MKKNTVQQIVIAGLLTGLGILVGAFTHFSFLGQIYLVGLIVFLMPLFLRIDLLLIATIATVVISDVISGFGHYSWMSAIVYSIAVILLWVFSKMKFKFMYSIGLLISACIVIGGYFILEMIAFDLAFAIKDVIGTVIEMAIIVPVVSILYFPMKIISKTLSK